MNFDIKKRGNTPLFYIDGGGELPIHEPPHILCNRIFVENNSIYAD